MAELGDVKEKVGRFLSECVGEYTVDDAGTMSFGFGSTRVFVWVTLSPVGESTLVNLRAHIAQHVPVNDDLYRWVVEETGNLLFGRLTLAPDRTRSAASLDLRHTLLGDRLDLEEIRAAVAFLTDRADELDDLVVDRFGGYRAGDSEERDFK